MGYIILIRHGESRWSKKNKFTGWVDVPLSEKGIADALLSSKKLKNIHIDVAFTSKLIRAQETLLLALAKQEKTGVFLHNTKWRKLWFLHSSGRTFEDNEIPIHSSDKLNDRYYGAIQGMQKDLARKTWGEEVVTSWRRDFTAKPPNGESLQQLFRRTTSYYKSTILKHIKANQNVIVCAHSNNLRAIVKNILDIGTDKVSQLRIDLKEPIIFKYDNNKFTLVNKKLSYTRDISWGKNDLSLKNILSIQKKIKIKKPKKVCLKDQLEVAKSKTRSNPKKVTVSAKSNKSSTKTTAKKKIVRKATTTKKKQTVKQKTVTKKTVPKKKIVKKQPIKKQTTKRKAATTTKKTVPKRKAVKKSAAKKKTARTTNKKTVKRSRRR